MERPLLFQQNRPKADAQGMIIFCPEAGEGLSQNPEMSARSSVVTITAAAPQDNSFVAVGIRRIKT